jgi:hypothetical protein
MTVSPLNPEIEEYILQYKYFKILKKPIDRPLPGFRLQENTQGSHKLIKK